MPTYPAPVLEIIYGSTTINLLARGKGWHLTGFRPRTAELKNGGTWQSSPLSNGRQPVSYRYDNIIDTWTVSADGYNEDGIIELAQELERAGVSALDYWTADWADTPVYIKARGPKETNTRYAIIHQIRVPEYADQYRQPMFGLDAPVMDGLSVIIEHGQWQNVAPGDQECVELSSVFAGFVGGWESLTTTPTGDVLALFKTSTGRILAGTDDTAKVFYSDDDGATWSILATIGSSGTDAVRNFAQSSVNGNLYAAVTGGALVRGLYHSTNNGASWTLTDGNQYDAYAVAVNANGKILYVGNAASTRVLNPDHSLANAISAPGGSFLPHRSAAAGYTDVFGSQLWLYGGTGIYSPLVENGSSRPFVSDSSLDGNVNDFLVISGVAYACTSSGKIYKIEWGPGASSLAPVLLETLPAASNRILQGSVLWYATSGNDLYKSSDGGATWSLETEVPTSTLLSLVESDDGDILTGGDGEIWSNTGLNEVFSGSASTCANQVYGANKAQITNLTNIKVYDDSATSFTDVYPMTAYPVELLPSTPADDDAVYFGIDTSLTDVDTGPFSSLVFDLSSPFVGWTTVAWEYWDGSAWSALTVKDNTLSLLQTGVNSVHWVPPSDWATTAVDGVTGYWVRFRVDTIATSPEPPEQQNRNIYAVVNPYVEISASQIGGDIPALARVRVENVSDRDGPGGSAPDLYTNRVIMGLRSVSRGELFTAYLNAADEQNPVGVTVTAGTDTTFANLVGAPSGRIAQWSPTGTGSWVTILTFSLATTIATQYYGTFRVFLRARQSGGTAGQMQLRLRTSTGSGGVSITTDAQVFANTNDHQIIDFGQLTIPLSAYLKSTELGDVLTIAVQGYTSSATPDANLYDLVLMPVDEWAADLTDGENSAASALASGFYLDVDSVSFPKRQLRNAVKSTGTNYTKAIWQQVANGPAILQANERQRLWLLTLRTASAGSSDWRSEPDAVHRVQMWSAERYRWARGSR